jgi:excisionase family DNA binding protein
MSAGQGAKTTPLRRDRNIFIIPSFRGKNFARSQVLYNESEGSFVRRGPEIGFCKGEAMAAQGIEEILLEEMPNRRLLKPGEVAAFLGVSPKTVYRWCDMGLMESIKLNRSVRVLRASVLTFLSYERESGLS